MSASEDSLSFVTTGPSVSIDGMAMDSVATAAVLREAKRSINVKELILRCVTIDGIVVGATKELFQADPTKIWNKVELNHCTGLNAQIVEACILQTQQFTFNGRFPIAHNNSRYSLDFASMRALRDALCDSTVLTSLSLKRSRLFRDCLEVFGEGLQQSKGLKTLLFSHCEIADADAPLLAAALQQSMSLTSYSMAHCKIGQSSYSAESTCQFAEILRAFVGHPSIQVLTLNGMYCSADAIKVMEEMLLHPKTKLQRLGLRNNGRNPEEKLNFTGLFGALKSNKTLTYLQVSGNNVDDADMEQLAEILTFHNHTLRDLSLPANRIGNSGLKSFAHRLPRMHGLRLLDVQRNLHTKEAQNELVAALEHNVDLERLDLDGSMDETKTYYLRLNKGGRRLLQQSANKLPAGIWPIVFERTNRLCTRNAPHANLDALYTLMKGPALFQTRPKRPLETVQMESDDDIEEPAKKKTRVR